MTADHSPFSHPFRVAALPARKATRFDLRPGDTALAAIAGALGLLGLGALNFRGELRPAGRRDWLLEADLEATVTQACIVTLAPVTSRVTERVIRRYVADLPEPEAEEVEMADETVELLPGVIDAGAVMVEALALALPPYPRAEGAEFAAAEARPEGASPLDDEETTRPFAGLADLIRKRGEAE
ncbi:YceD family protein [Albidovulum sp.]|uniref:YceD family protein n=1 Tax=Albidovulum sp. TaxID=1872424 RepID=UPI0039B90AFB